MQGRKARVAEISHVSAELAQPVDQIANRPFVHARHTLQDVIATGQRQRRRQRAKGRPGVAQEELGLLDWKSAGATRNAPVLATQMINADPQHLQRVKHALGIVRSQQVAHLRFPFGQRCQQQDTVGNTFRARQANGAGSGDELGEVEEFHVMARSRTIRTGPS